MPSIESSSTATAASSGGQRPRVLSGIAATGKLHIGNYLGALRGWAQEQDIYDNYYFIADLHALTVPENIRPDEFRENVTTTVALYVACGLDPEKSVIFRQSDVSAHSQLAWLFDCVTPVGWLERMTQFKVKAKSAMPSAGLLTYPVLQAADILLYQAKYVPVGDDQRQHVELTRDIAKRFNHLFGEFFVMPEALIRETGARIMGLDDPTAKMSKSVAIGREGHAIGLLDPPDVVRRTVMRAVTDSQSHVNPAELSPGVENLIALFAALEGISRDAAIERFDGRGYGVLKKAVAELAVETTSTIQARYQDLRGDEDYMTAILADGAERARVVADTTLDAAMEAVGLRARPAR